MYRVSLAVGVGILHAVSWALTAHGQTLEAAIVATAEGRFVEAADLGEAVGTSESCALAAEALAVYGHYVAEEDQRPAAFQRGMELGERAIALDASNPQAHLQWAHALGRYSETLEPMEAYRQGLAKQMREGVEEALALDPKLADAHLMLAGWHAGAVKNGGVMARIMFGASNDRAKAHYDQALRLAPDSKNVLFHYARGLLLMDADRNRSEARTLFARAAETPSTTAYERILDAEAAEELAALDRR